MRSHEDRTAAEWAEMHAAELRAEPLMTNDEVRALNVPPHGLTPNNSRRLLWKAQDLVREVGELRALSAFFEQVAKSRGWKSLAEMVREEARP